MVHPKQISVVFKSEKQKKKKKKKGPHLFLLLFLLPFPIFHLPFYNFTIFLLIFIFTHFPFFPFLFFPDTSAKLSRSEVECPPAPPPVTPLVYTHKLPHIRMCFWLVINLGSLDSIKSNLLRYSNFKLRDLSKTLVRGELNSNLSFQAVLKFRLVLIGASWLGVLFYDWHSWEDQGPLKIINYNRFEGGSELC